MMKITKLGFCSALLLTAACGSVTEPPPARLWQASLTALLVDDPLEGSAAMVSQSTFTQVGVGVQNAPPDAVLGWNVRNGTCEGAGEPLAPAASFPGITVDAEGAGDAEMVLNRRLPEGDYAVQVYADNSGTGVMIACGNFETFVIE